MNWLAGWAIAAGLVCWLFHLGVQRGKRQQQREREEMRQHVMRGSRRIG